MDTNMQNTPQSAQQAQQAPVSSVEYASFLQRFLAALVDGVILLIVGLFLGMLFGVAGAAADQEEFFANIANLFGTIIGWIYYVYMDVKMGATIGKKVLGLRVQNEATGNNLTVVEAILREIVGKFLSGIVLLLGYFWVIWDPKKQAWHDKLAKSIVIKVK